MKNFTNPLNNIHIASPCSANWDEMYGDNRKRFCGDCKLNVYNLSGMTKNEAENLLLNTEGRLCIRFYRRNDGTILTKDCPVGWQAIKRRVSGVAAAAFSMIVGIFGGIFAFNQANSVKRSEVGVMTVKTSDTTNEIQDSSAGQYTMGANAMPQGTPVNLDEIRKDLKNKRK